jgi:hypothetical protein
MWHRIASLIVASCLAPAPLPAWAAGPIAEVICFPRATLVERLRVQYGATLAGSGLRNMEMVMEIWTDPQGDWTLVQNYTDGKSCILAMGEFWETAREDGAKG